jgi:hypothetical protein
MIQQLNAKKSTFYLYWIFITAFVMAVVSNNSASEAAQNETTTDTENYASTTAAGIQDENFYHTPLAGEACNASILGRLIRIPERDRENTLSLTLGANFYDPEVGGNLGLPIAALYWRHRWDKWWTRNVIGVFVNEMDVARSFGRIQLLGHFDNNTVPFADTEIKDGNEVKTSSVIWGTVSGWLGAGIRIPVAPFQADNDFRLQLFYHAGYFYDKRTNDTGTNVRLPPDTFVHGLRLRARYDGLRRNIMELPHEGWAAGGDFELTRRDRWSDSTFGSLLFKRDETRDYLKMSGYVIGAGGIPWLSERHRLVGYLHGGVSPIGELDRFSAFRAGGGPFPNETDDLYRLPYPGALFNDFPVSDYVVGTLEYRLELLFFLYLHLRGTFAWGANRPDYSDSQGLRLRLTSTDGEAFSVGLTSGFFNDSQLYLEYAYDTKLLRNGKSGNCFMLLWSKSL